MTAAPMTPADALAAVRAALRWTVCCADHDHHEDDCPEPVGRDARDTARAALAVLDGFVRTNEILYQQVRNEEAAAFERQAKEYERLAAGARGVAATIRALAPLAAPKGGSDG